MSEIAEFRKAKDQFFKTSAQSPLAPEQKRDFAGLNYFDENPALRFELPLERYSDPERVAMQTSTGTTQDYDKIGQVRFEVSGEAAALQVYESVDNPGSYFVPFVDATAPAESYGAGRYLEPEETHADELLVDFNFAYNPYCAYVSEKWSCPLPPPENRLKVRIEAGEQNFHG
ncbi:MAG: DUF1684 domain-containing protein [Chloroflexi bacterium]|nr:DUF1684 domain-containing protein [Chloroflexota bacterium]